MTPLVDSHCHLRFPELASQNDAVIDRARQAGLVRMVTIGTRQEEWQATREVAHRYDEVFYALGLHPEYATDNVTADDLVAASNDPKMVGIGETGFDFFYDNAPKDDQERCFREHIRASIRTGLPLIIHSRQAEEDTIRVLKEERVGHEKELTGVLHCFSSRKFLADYALDIGFYVSLSGILTFKKSQELRDIAKRLAARSLAGGNRFAVPRATIAPWQTMRTGPMSPRPRKFWLKLKALAMMPSANKQRKISSACLRK